MNTRHEEYTNFEKGLPFVLNCNIKRNSYAVSEAQNWHEDLEIQFCEEGTGTVILNGDKYNLEVGKIAVANSNVIHYTGSQENIVYSCLIISFEFCRDMGIDCSAIEFDNCFEDIALFNLFSDLKNVFNDENRLCKKAKLNEIVLKILIKSCGKSFVWENYETN